MFDNAHGGNDTLTAISGSGFSATLLGDASAMSGNAWGGDDVLTVNGSSSGSYNYLFGDAIYLDDNTHGGNDTLIGGAGNDTLYGDAQGYSPLPSARLPAAPTS